MGKRSRRSPAVLKIRCTATSKQAGRRCRRWATPGSRVCWVHGAAIPHVLAKAEVAEAVELVKNGNGERPVQQVFHDAVQIADLALQDLLDSLPPTLSPQDAEALLVAASRAALIAKAADHGMLSVRSGQLRHWSEERLKAWQRRRAVEQAGQVAAEPEPASTPDKAAQSPQGPAPAGIVPGWGAAAAGSPWGTRMVP